MIAEAMLKSRLKLNYDLSIEVVCLKDIQASRSFTDKHCL